MTTKEAAKKRGAPVRVAIDREQYDELREAARANKESLYDTIQWCLQNAISEGVHYAGGDADE